MKRERQLRRIENAIRVTPTTTDEKLVHFVHAWVWTVAPNASSTLVAAAIADADKAQQARQVNEASSLPLAPKGQMTLVLTNRNLLFWQKKGLRRQLHLLGGIPIEEVLQLEGDPGNVRFERTLLASAVVLFVGCVIALSYLGRWMAGLLALASMAVATFLSARSEFQGSNLLLRAGSGPVRLRTGKSDDPVAFASAFNITNNHH